MNIKYREERERIESANDHPGPIAIQDENNLGQSIQSQVEEWMFQALIEYQMLDAEEVWVYLDDRDPEEDFQLQSIRRGFEEEVLPEDNPNFEFRTLPQVSYDSYTDRLRGE